MTIAEAATVFRVFRIAEFFLFMSLILEIAIPFSVLSTETVSKLSFTATSFAVSVLSS